MKKVTIDLDALDSALMHLTGRSASTVIRGALESLDETPKPSPPPTPSLDILRRFAKVAGGSAEPSLEEGAWKINIPPIVYGHFREEKASRWLDSPEALDAAAIVAIRKGRGLLVEKPLDKVSARVFTYWPDGNRYPGQRDWASEATPGRAAVVACLAAFEEK